MKTVAGRKAPVPPARRRADASGRPGKARPGARKWTAGAGTRRTAATRANASRTRTASTASGQAIPTATLPMAGAQRTCSHWDAPTIPQNGAAWTLIIAGGSITIPQTQVEAATALIPTGARLVAEAAEASRSSKSGAPDAISLTTTRPLANISRDAAI